MQRVPKYVMCINDIMVNKRFLIECVTISLIEECISGIQNNLLFEWKDPLSYIIIVGRQVAWALCDLRVGINLMPSCILQIWVLLLFFIN